MGFLLTLALTIYFGVATSQETNPGDRSSETTNAVQEPYDNT